MKTLDEANSFLQSLQKKIKSSFLILGMEEKQKQLKLLKTKQNDPNIYKNVDVLKHLGIELKKIENLIGPWLTLSQEIEDIEVLIEMAEEEKSLFEEVLQSLQKNKKKFEELEIRLLFREKMDTNNAFITIHPGAGGTESCDWANMLYRMYIRFSEEKNLKVKTIDYQNNDEAGLKSATLHIEGIYAHGLLKSESGVHRLVRISPFDSNKKRHTSFCSIYVSAEIEDDIEIDIKPSDIRIDTYRASGAGGQHVNTTDSAVRITHIKTGIVVTSQSERSQIKNRQTTMKVLRARLYEYYQREKEKEIQGPDKKKIEWGSQIRSYVFHPYNMVKDHRSSEETSDVEGVMDGKLSNFIHAYLKLP